MNSIKYSGISMLNENGISFFNQNGNSIENQQWSDSVEEHKKKHLEHLENMDKQSDNCLHDNCTKCFGTGRKSDGSMCMHGIACPCRKCTPSY